MSSLVLPERRNSLRMPGWDYSGVGAYFVTICTLRRVQCLSVVEGSTVKLLPAGQVIIDEWNRTEVLRPSVKLDRRVVMPDHFQAIIWIDSTNPSPQETTVPTMLAPHHTLGTVISQFKAACTKSIRETVDSTFAWQRGYYDVALRRWQRLDSARSYIAANPRNWRRAHER